MQYPYNPVDNLQPLADHNILVLSVCEQKTFWYWSGQQCLLKKIWGIGRKMTIIEKQDSHHSHSLKDPAPIVQFILKERLRWSLWDSNFSYQFFRHRHIDASSKSLGCYHLRCFRYSPYFPEDKSRCSYRFWLQLFKCLLHRAVYIFKLPSSDTFIWSMWASVCWQLR